MGSNTKRRQSSEDRTYAALAYYRRDIWTPRRLRDKAGRQAIRLLALNKAFHEKTGQEVLAKNTKRALAELIPRKPSTRTG
jgi:hypothetical protein